MTEDLAFHSAKRLASLIRRGKLGCLELLELYLKRCERHNGAINAVVVWDLNAARTRARAADRAAAKGDWWGPLHGVPITIKESFDVVGMPTTWGLEAFKNNLPKKNAVAVQRLLNRGAVLFGKTNVPVLLADWQTFNPIYGTTNNPWDLTKVPGGSSGGAAAALAAGLTALETGSDIGASIRDPAHFCGVYGHKTTCGIASIQGQSLPDSVAELDISVIGPMARSADDLALGLQAIAGPNDIDAVGWKLALPPPRKRVLKEFKVAVMLSHPTAEVDREVQSRIQVLAEFLAGKKVKVSDKARPSFDPGAAHRVFIQLLRAATSGRMADALFRRQLEVKSRLSPGDQGYYAQMIRANTMYHKDWHRWTQ
jgi:amidase